MARAKGMLNLSGNIEVLAGAPFDARDKVPTKADLTVASNFQYPYVGMETYVEAENKKYRFTGGDTTNLNNWQLLSEDEVTVDSELSELSENPVQNKVITNAIGDKVDKVDGKGLSTNDYTTAEKEKLAGIDLTNYIPTSQKGANSGVAELDANGKVPSSQLPSFVDDVEEYASSSQFPVTGETGKIYVDTSTNISYRWSGSDYVRIGSDLALGETSSTAYRGDRGKIAYDDSQTNKTNIGTMANLTTTEKSSLVGAINELKQTGGGTIDSTPTSGSLNAVQSGGTYTALEGKVDKVAGKGLSTEDYTTAEKTKLEGLSNYDDTSLSGRVSDIEDVVPSTASSSNKLATMSDVNSTNGHTIEDASGNDMSARSNLQFTGGATVTDDSTNDRTVVEIPQAYNLPAATTTTLGGVKVGNGLSINEGVLSADGVTTDATPTQSSTNPVQSGGVYTALQGKVDTVTGKGLSTNDYTTAEKEKLESLENYDDTELSGRVSDIEDVVPSTATASNKLATMSDVASAEGHTIEDASGNDMTARTNLQFAGGATVTDDSTNNRTVVTIPQAYSLPTASSDTLGGVKVGSGLSIADGVLSADGITTDATPTQSSTNAVQSGGVYTALQGKVDTVSGKQLSTEDYTTAEKTKLQGLSNYDDTVIQGKVSDIEDVIPSNASTSNKLATISDISGSSGHTIENASGTEMTARSNLQFVGATVSDDSTNDRTVVTVPTITTDSTPTQSSTNAVQSGGVYTALQGKANGEGMTFTLDERNVLNVATESDTPSHYALPAGGTTGQVLTKASNDDDDVEWANSSYTLPTASDSTLGGIKVGSGLSIDANGFLSSSGGSGGGHIILDDGTPMEQEGDLNFVDFDLSDDSTNQQTVVQPHEITSEEWEDVIDTLPGTPTELPVLFDERETEYQVGWYVNSSGLKKPVYEKTVNCGKLPNASQKSVAHNISNIENVINIFGFTKYGTTFTPLVRNSKGGTACEVIVIGSNLRIDNNYDGTAFDCYTTLQYTKTTDTPV